MPGKGLKGTRSLGSQPLASQPRVHRRGHQEQCRWSCSPWFPQEQQGRGVAKGLKKVGEVPYLEPQGSFHCFWAASSIPRPDGRVSAIVSSPWVGVVFPITVFPSFIACPCSLPDAACLSPRRRPETVGLSRPCTSGWCN